MSPSGRSSKFFRVSDACTLKLTPPPYLGHLLHTSWLDAVEGFAELLAPLDSEGNFPMNGKSETVNRASQKCARFPPAQGRLEILDRFESF
jgi:hypothetical protein